MRANDLRLVKIVCIVMMCVVFVMVLGITPLQAGKCESGFMMCIHDPFWMSMFGSLYCANGYLFCKKYLE